MVREGATIAIMDLEMNFCLDKVIVNANIKVSHLVEKRS